MKVERIRMGTVRHRPRQGGREDAGGKLEAVDVVLNSGTTPPPPPPSPVSQSVSQRKVGIGGDEKKVRASVPPGLNFLNRNLFLITHRRIIIIIFSSSGKT
ncbi:unnamed protein product [Darwinula stevensoni]|uniref:Uncharacterized protein n=1 Tax=Darwinula stevensoni TaxID=69355 RepID=A0A7R9AIV1_9CRUS|nr:unnamed protein product [Darwinula stevensoni]CAG0906466.1 unnamed protein product [Darwinula stevensoni]